MPTNFGQCCRSLKGVGRSVGQGYEVGGSNVEEATWRMQRGGCGVARDLGAFIVHELDEAIIFQFARVKIPVEKAERERERERERASESESERARERGE